MFQASFLVLKSEEFFSGHILSVVKIKKKTKLVFQTVDKPSKR